MRVKNNGKIISEFDTACSKTSDFSWFFILSYYTSKNGYFRQPLLTPVVVRPGSARRAARGSSVPAVPLFIVVDWNPKFKFNCDPTHVLLWFLNSISKMSSSKIARRPPCSSPRFRSSSCYLKPTLPDFHATVLAASPADQDIRAPGAPS